MKRRFSVKSSLDVYPPSEDTWFLTEFLVNFLSRFKVNTKQKRVICEIGVGSGYIIIYLSLNFSHLRFYGTDISPIALSLSKENFRDWIPTGNYYLCCSPYLNCFNPQKFFPDIIYFNPPYVSTSYEEYNQTNSVITKSWAGGPSGVIPISLYLDELTRFEFKLAFFLTSSLNENNIVLTREEFNIKEVAKKKIESEQLIIYQVTPRV